MTWSFFHQQSTDSAIFANFTVSINTLTRKHLFHLIVTSLMPLCLSLLIYKMGTLITPSVLFFFELNAGKQVKEDRLCLVDLSIIPNFVFFLIDGVDIELFSPTIYRQCHFCKFYCAHKYAHHKVSCSLISHFLNASVPQFTHLHNGSALCF